MIADFLHNVGRLRVICGPCAVDIFIEIVFEIVMTRKGSTMQSGGKDGMTGRIGRKTAQETRSASKFKGPL